jgi:biotin operon repressor
VNDPILHAIDNELNQLELRRNQLHRIKQILSGHPDPESVATTPEPADKPKSDTATKPKGAGKQDVLNALKALDRPVSAPELATIMGARRTTVTTHLTTLTKTGGGVEVVGGKGTKNDPRIYALRSAALTPNDGPKTDLERRILTTLTNVGLEVTPQELQQHLDPPVPLLSEVLAVMARRGLVSKEGSYYGLVADTA